MSTACRASAWGLWRWRTHRTSPPVQPRLGAAAPEEPRYSTWAPTGLPRHLARSAGTALRPLTPASPERDHVAVSVSIALSTFGPTDHRAACCTVPGVLRGATCWRQGLRTPVMCPTTAVTWRLPQHGRKGENLRAVGRSRRSRGASRVGHTGGALGPVHAFASKATTRHGCS